MTLAKLLLKTNRRPIFLTFSLISSKESDMIKLQIFTLLSLFAIFDAANLPTYLTRCRITDPYINECIKKNGNKAIRDLAKGDIHYDIPSVMPLKVQGPIVSKENNQQIVVTDLQINGLESASISEMDLNLEKGSLNMMLEVPVITAHAKCHIIGDNFISNQESLNEKFNGAIVNFIADFSVEEIDGEMWFTKFEHYYKLQSQEPSEAFFPAVGSLKVYKTVCQRRFPQIISKQIGDYLTNTFRGFSQRVPVGDFFKQ